MAESWTTKQIAMSLGIGVHAVQEHKRSIMRRLGVTNEREAVEMGRFYTAPLEEVDW